MDIKILFFENAPPTVGEAISEKAIPEDAGFEWDVTRIVAQGEEIVTIVLKAVKSFGGVHFDSREEDGVEIAVEYAPAGLGGFCLGTFLLVAIPVVTAIGLKRKLDLKN